MNPNEIRLLKPLSRSSNALSFEIIHISLLSKPRYGALSYTWGPPGDAHTILLNGQPFPSRQDLYDALQQIQCSKLVDQYLWVDAICTNQGRDDDALHEKGLQITRMTQIYEQATKILVWLGIPDNDPDNEANNQLAFPMMKYFEKRYRQIALKGRGYQPWWWPHKPRTAGQNVADFLLNLHPANDKKIFDVPGSRTYKAWLGVISLWKSPWWTRTWFFKNQRSQRNTRHFSLRESSCCHSRANTTLVATTILTTPGIDSQFLVGAQKSVDKLVKFRSQRIQHLLVAFLDILQMFRDTQCFDPRDKVYAPLCLAPDDVRRCITPDYDSKSVLDVYTDVVRYYLAQPGHDLDFLGYALYQEETQVVETPQGVKSILPSWVPNFSASLDIAPIPKILHVPEKNQDRRAVVFYDKRGTPSNKEALIAAYRPLGDAPSRSFIEDEDNTLCTSGVYIDTLKDVIKNTGPGLEVIRAIAEEKGRKWAVNSMQKYFTGESFADAISQTSVLDLIYDEQGRPSERGGKADTAFLRRPRAELSPVEYRYQMNMRMARSKACILRDLGLSQKSLPLMIPNTAVVGDLIWALAGGQVLYVLRPMNTQIKQYRFIGECYAHGLMDGDILRRLQLGEVRMEDISLV
ncbi:hypothetical protein JMJ35_001175 [Cladonia borealis]|uniref:Heterokaryon incompatibility domain-containing protein n=1 Tax=Cladonia borealis TaxID=184061 RepID=A0AA39R7Z6_9LECA|nr:hypothetical protein JMJ35_001175 [Cladonia borealis]